MTPDQIKVLKDAEIPEAIRAELAKQYFAQQNTE